MRQGIKFRGKRTDNGEWIYGSLAINKNGSCQISDHSDDFRFWHSVDPETVGQYTGLDDKTGKEIYEGDIIQFTNPKMIAEVVWAYAAFHLKWHHENTKRIRLRGLSETEPIFHNIHLFEVIGNIHDNPELLSA